MEESVVPKRPREEAQVKEEDVVNNCDEESSKRHKPYNHILSLLESEEEDSLQQDLSPIITTLQQEITNCASHSDTLLSQPKHITTNNTTLDDCETSNDTIVEEDDKERVMRHLLEASDDELGIPNRGDDELVEIGGEKGFNGGDMFSSISDGLWELEDETANYYALLQSELFL